MHQSDKSLLTETPLEVMVFSGPMSAEQRAIVEGYLAHKWGIALPHGHPYEHVAPKPTLYGRIRRWLRYTARGLCL